VPPSVPAAETNHSTERRRALVTNDLNDVTVAELMTDEIITCHGDAQLATVAGQLARRRIHAVLSSTPPGVHLAS
jgi:hypothetical protein